jgi:hypothetical protein
VTNDAGRFVFNNLKPGKYRLLAAHPRGLYYPVEYGQRSPRGPGYNFSFEENQTMRVRLEMAPMGSVTGRVIGADGLPAAHVHVMAAEIAYQNGARVLNQVQAVQTDDRGDYRLFWLPPGRYYVGAFPEGLRKRNYSAAFAPPGSVSSINATYRTSLLQYVADRNGEIASEAYEVVYAPGDTNFESARIIDLRSNPNASGVDISLASGRHRALKIRGVVIDGATGQPAPRISVRAIPRKQGPAIFAPETTSNVDGSFEIAGVISGGYLVAATAPAAPNTQSSPVVQNVDVGASDIEGLRIVLTPGSRISVRVTLDGQPTSDYRIVLRRETNLLPVPSITALNGVLFFNGVQPGDYSVSPVASTPNGPLANVRSANVRSTRYGGVESATGAFHVAQDSVSELEVELTSSSGTIVGNVIEGQKTAPNAIVIVVSTGAARGSFYSTATDGSGNFRIQNVVPGSYIAVASSWLQPGIAQHPDFLRAVQGRGTSVTVGEGANATVTLNMLPEVVF